MILLFIVFVSGLYLFTAGYFLSRVELRLRSSCCADPFKHFSDSLSSSFDYDRSNPVHYNNPIQDLLQFAYDFPACWLGETKWPSSFSQSTESSTQVRAGKEGQPENSPSVIRSSPPSPSESKRRPSFSAFKRLLLILIDGWRFDFAEPPSASSDARTTSGEDSRNSNAKPFSHFRGKVCKAVQRVGLMSSLGLSTTLKRPLSCL
jgi:hypothetical protein